MKTVRQKLVDQVIARMQSISIANGYQTNIGERVSDFPTQFDESELPALGVYDLVEKTTKDYPQASKVTHDLPVQIRVFIKSDTLPEDLRVMIGDVISAIGKDTRWDGMALDTEPEEDGFIIPEGQIQVAGAAVGITIKYMTRTFDPYNQ